MDRSVVFVDAGYLFAEGARLLVGEARTRSQVRLEHARVLQHLEQLSKSLTGLPLLRTYWYDAATCGPTSTQTALAYQPSLKLRLGKVDSTGGQQNVDAKIVADLEQLAANGAMADALLLTGDGDLLAGVCAAQGHGVRVHLVGIEPARTNQAGILVREVDSVHELSRADLESFMTILAG